MSQNRRRVYTVDPRIKRFYMLIWGLSLLMLILLGLLVYVISDAETLIRWPQEAQLLGFNYLLWVGGVAVLLTVSAIGLSVFATLHTHRMHGAALSIRRSLEALAEGQEARHVNLRPGDHFEEIAIHVNKLIDNLGQPKP